MTREYQSLPENDTIETPFGEMAVRFMCDGDYPTITLDGSINGAFITVNGVLISASLMLTDYGDGFELRRDFDPAQYSKDSNDTFGALFASRIWDESRSGPSAFDVSDAAKRKIRETLPAIADEWAQGKDGLFVEARRVTANNDIRRLQVELEEAEAKVAELKEQIATGETRYAAIR